MSDAVYECVLSRHGRKQAIQLSTAVGYVAMMNLIANPFDLPDVPDSARPAL